MKELLNNYLNQIDKSPVDEKIHAYQTLYNFLIWLESNHELVITRKGVLSCEHEFEIIDKYFTTKPHWWDSHEVKIYNIIQRCVKCGKVIKESV